MWRRTVLRRSPKGRTVKMTNLKLNYSYRSKGRQASKLENCAQRQESLSLLSTAQLARITDTSKSTWEKMRMRGQGPQYIKVRNLVWYRWVDVNAWLAAHQILTKEVE